MKKILMISRGPVGPDFNGGSMTVWGMLNSLLNITESLKIIIFFEKIDKNNNEFLLTKKYLDQLNIGYEFVFINHFVTKKSYFERILKFDYSYFFLTYLIRKKVFKIISKHKYDFLFCYHFDSLSLVPKKLKDKTIALLGDQMHEPRILRRKLFNTGRFKRIVLDLSDRIFFYMSSRKLLNSLHHVFYFANYYTENNKKNSYIRTPLSDELSNIDINKYISDKFSTIDSQKIIMIGALHGTVTISGLIFLNNFLIKYNTKKKFIVIGSGSLNEKTESLSKQENVSFIGRVDNLQSIFYKNKIILVPNSIILGIRVRIITAFMYGLIIITHSSNLHGIPELQHNHNCLVFKNYNELNIILNSLNKLNLKELSRNARETYEKLFSSESFVENKIIKKILTGNNY